MSAPLSPPSTSEATSAPLVLHAPEAPALVELDEAPGMVPVAADRQQEIYQQARAFVAEAVALDPRTPAFDTKVEGISQIGSAEMTQSSSYSRRMLQRSSTSVAGAKSGGNSVQTAVANTLSELRKMVEYLTPNDAALGLGRKILGFIPGGKKLAAYFEKYESAQVQIDTIIKSLMAGQDQLLKDNASLAGEKAQLWETMQALSEYAVFAKALDAECVGRIEANRAAGRVGEAQKLETDLLFPIRQRHQDLLTQLAVSVQGYLAMDLIRKNNLELIRGVDRARTTTIAALRMAVIVAQALADQKIVLDRVDAITTSTNTLLANQASDSGASVETLRQAFVDVFATIDAIDAFRAATAKNIEGTVSVLESGLEKTRPSVESSLN